MTIGFMVTLHLLKGFMVSYTPSLDRFHGFMVLQTQSQGHQDDNRFHGFVVLWICGFFHSISGTSNAERFRGFMVSKFH